MLLVQSVSLRRVIGAVGGQSSVSLRRVIGSVSESQMCYWCSGRTEFQSASVSRLRRSVRFERKASQRYSRRPVFEKRDRDTQAAAAAGAAAAAAASAAAAAAAAATERLGSRRTF